MRAKAKQGEIRLPGNIKRTKAVLKVTKKMTRRTGRKKRVIKSSQKSQKQ